MSPFDLSHWHATTKTYAYFEVFGFFRIFFRKNCDPTMVKSHFKKYNGKSIFESAIFLNQKLNYFNE